MKSKNKPSTSEKRVDANLVGSSRIAKKQVQVCNLRELFILNLRTIYWFENRLVKAMPAVIRHARSMELVNALEIHLMIINNQLRLLKAVFDSINETAIRVKNPAVSALIRQLNEPLKQTEETMVRDSAIILSLQQVIHHNIAFLGSLQAFATTLGEYETAMVLSAALQEEKNLTETSHK